MADINKTDIGGRTLDARSLYCPEPVMMLHHMIRNISHGETIRLLATDPSTKRDIPKFCQFLGHELLQQHEERSEDGDGENVYTFVILKLAQSPES